MMQQIPIQPLPNQTLQVQLGTQACVLNIYQMAYGLFVDLYVGNVLIVAGQIAQNLNRLVRYKYLGFIGDLAFLDTQSATSPADPIYTGLGSRFVLLYLEETDLPD